MRIGFYGMSRVAEEQRADIYNRIMNQYKKYVLEFVEGVQNESQKASDTELKAFCEENEVKINQIATRWNDLTGCKFPRTDKYGKPFNAEAGYRRDRELIDYLKGHKKNMLVIMFDKNDKYAGYSAWYAQEHGVPVYMLDIESGEWITNRKKDENKAVETAPEATEAIADEAA